MNYFNVGALRRATDSARLSAANNLVQRTLAQHGLVPPTDLSDGTQIFSLNDVPGRFGSSAASPQPDLPDGAEFRQDRFTCSAGSRAFRTYVPASAEQGSTGVVVMLHGCTQTPEDFAASTGMNALAEKFRFVVVYPAQSRGGNAQSCWNWFKRGDQRRGTGEPAILAGITAQVCVEHGVGRDRTFVAGLSAGAAMAVILGEVYSDVFAAVGAHSGLPVGVAKDVPSAFAAMAGNAMEAPAVAAHTGTTRTIVFHGSADATVHPCNGAAIAQRAADANTAQSVETTTQGEANGRRFTCHTSSNTQGTTAVEHWIVDGQGHAWSGGQPGGSHTDHKGPDASAEMIRFFYETPKQDL